MNDTILGVLVAVVAAVKFGTWKCKYSLNTQTHGSLDGLAVSDQVGSILVLLPQQILALLPADGAVVARRHSCCHGERQDNGQTSTTPTFCFLRTASSLRSAALRSPPALIQVPWRSRSGADGWFWSAAEKRGYRGRDRSVLNTWRCSAE